MGLFLVGLVLTLASGSEGLARDIKTSAQYTVSLGAVRIGVFWLDGSTSPRAYTVSGGFRTTGVVSGLANVTVSLSARGAVTPDGFYPNVYQEEVRVGRRSASMTMTFRDGVPSVAGEKFGEEQEDVPPVDPTTQRDTLDPISATFVLLRTQPLRGACKVDRFQFDGERRTRIVMTKLRQDGADWVCTGQFLRLEGYSARDLRRSGAVDVTVRYARVGEDLVATGAEFTSLRGTLKLTRR